MPELVFEGRWSSGDSASGVSANIIFEAGGLAINSPEGERLAFWKFEDLLPATPIASSDRDALLRHAQTPRATLFIRGDGIGKLLISQAPRTAQSYQRFKIVSYSLIFTAITALAAAILFFGHFSASKIVAAVIPFEAAGKLGSQSVEIFGPVAPACVNQPGNAALQRILERLQGGGEYGRAFTLHVAQSSIANAFALPGRHIVVLSGLIKQAKSPEEVAGVLAHEMGHGIERDPEALFVRNLGMQIAIQFLTGQSGAQTPITAGALLLQLRYSRDAERAADNHAIEILKSAHIAAQPTADFFLRDPAPSLQGNLLNYLSTHPSSKERAELFRSQASYPSEPILSSKEWTDAQAICGEPVKKPVSPPNAPQPAKGKS